MRKSSQVAITVLSSIAASLGTAGCRPPEYQTPSDSPGVQEGESGQHRTSGMHYYGSPGFRGGSGASGITGNNGISGNPSGTSGSSGSVSRGGFGGFGGSGAAS